MKYYIAQLILFVWFVCVGICTIAWRLTKAIAIYTISFFGALAVFGAMVTLNRKEQRNNKNK